MSRIEDPEDVLTDRPTEDPEVVLQEILTGLMSKSPPERLTFIICMGNCLNIGFILADVLADHEIGLNALWLGLYFLGKNYDADAACEILLDLFRDCDQSIRVEAESYIREFFSNVIVSPTAF